MAGTPTIPIMFHFMLPCSVSQFQVNFYVLRMLQILTLADRFEATLKTESR
jgi:hypothetical protein